MMRLGSGCRVVFPLVILFLFASARCVGQSTNATVTGQITDQSGKVVPDVVIIFTNINTGVPYTTKTNGEGTYTLPALQPGVYRANVTKDGFKSIVKSDIELHVQDQVSINFALQIGSISETVTVEAGASTIDTQGATVSTVVDRQFAENLPLNGRSFQTLIELTPGVVVTPSNFGDGGQFSVNGQRSASNYWMVDGVSANIGVSSSYTPGNGFGGALPAFSVLGGTNSLVSVDALQEFRIQTSTYAPEFGRTPGGQISIVTRSGTNQFHGTAFDYVRNDALDANNWFNGYTNNPPLPKAEEQQNDFGGTLSGPIVKNRTFFFFSYEGLRLRLPETSLTTVPDLTSRQNAVAAMQPYLDAYPVPSPDAIDVAPGIAPYNASYSNAATLDAYSLRIDHRLTSKLTLFGRYNYSPSELTQRGAQSTALSSVSSSRISIQTGTVGATWEVSPDVINDLRFNYSHTNSSTYSYLDNFGGATLLTNQAFPNPYSSEDASLVFYVTSLLGSGLAEGQNGQNLQRQVNIVDNFSVQRGSHGMKFGVDFRRLSPEFVPQAYSQIAYFFDLPSAMQGTLPYGLVSSGRPGTLLFHNLGMFAQDTWRVFPRLTITYGLRWDVDFAPSSLNGPNLLAVTGVNLDDLSELALAPSGTPPFRTTFGNFAPRVGVAYEVSQRQNRQTVVRGGFGVFYDLATQEAGNLLYTTQYPFGSQKNLFGVNFPLDPTSAAPLPISVDNLTSGITAAFDPNLKLPYTLQWNIAFEQALGDDQTLSASYIGSVGRRLIQTAEVSEPNPSFESVDLVTNAGTSNYNALQVQFQRRLSHGLQALTSYTWSHSIDTASAGSFVNAANTLVPTLNPNANRGPSDFDIRNAFSAGLTYDIPSPNPEKLYSAILGGWSTDNIIIARSAPPVNVYEGTLYELFNGEAQVRPDVIAGVPLYLYGSRYPGGKAINNTPGAVAGGCPGGSQSVGPFCSPPTDSSGNPTRQGDLSRNALRGFSATEWDFALHRTFPIHESLNLQFRAEMFNVLNHPNFGQPQSAIGLPNFGLSTQMLGQSLAGTNLGGGAFDPLYQIGGPRSVQFALKLMF